MSAPVRVDGESYRGGVDAGGRRHGREAELALKNGDVYVGGFVHGRRSGVGNLFRRDSGDLFRGRWLNDRREGPGILQYGNSGKILQGHWVDDVCVSGELVDPSSSALPVLGLADSAAVLAQAERAAEEERRLYRAKYLPVDALLPADVLAKAAALFEANAAAFATKEVSARKAALQAVLDTLEIPSGVSDEEVKTHVDQEAFMRVVAVHFVKSR